MVAGSLSSYNSSKEPTRTPLLRLYGNGACRVHASVSHGNFLWPVVRLCVWGVRSFRIVFAASFPGACSATADPDLL